jgi:drug/metabolite transporter (DMT)-like permease
MQTLRAAPWQLWFLLLGAIWGCSFLFIKLGLASFSPVQVAFGRVLIGAIVLQVIAQATGTRLPRGRKAWRDLTVVALLFCSVPFTLFAFGETQVSSILAGIINSGTPLMTLLVALVAYPEQRPGRDRIVGLVVGFAGVLIVSGAWNGLGGGELLGVLALVGAILCYGLAYPYTRRHLAGIPEGPIAIATAQVGLGALLLLPLVVGVTLADPGPARPVLPESILGMLALGAFGSGIAYVLSFHLVIEAGSTVASSVTYITPLFAVAAGMLFLSEPVSWNEPVGGLVVLLGVAISQGVVRVPGRRGAALETPADRAAEVTVEA